MKLSGQLAALAVPSILLPDQVILEGNTASGASSPIRPTSAGVNSDLIQLSSSSFLEVAEHLSQDSIKVLLHSGHKFRYDRILDGEFSHLAKGMEIRDAHAMIKPELDAVTAESLLRQLIQAEDFSGQYLDDFLPNPNHSLDEYIGTLGIPYGATEFLMDSWFQEKELIKASVARVVADDRLVAKEYLQKFLNMALHSKSGTGLMLTLVQELMIALDLSWESVLEARQKDLSGFERGLLEFLSEGPKPLDEYFAHAMFDESIGTYICTKPENLIGGHSESTFATHADYDIFQTAVLMRLFESWTELGCPNEFEVVEMGAGQGSLAKGVLQKLRTIKAFHSNDDWVKFADSLKYRIVEISPLLADFQRESLKDFDVQVNNVSAIDGDWAPVKNGVYLSNELVDMFPPKKIKMISGELKEAYMVAVDGLIQEVFGELTDKAKTFLDRHSVSLVEGGVYYALTDMDRWLENLDSKLERGHVLSIDYGDKRKNLLNDHDEYFDPSFRGYASTAKHEVFWNDVFDIVPEPFKHIAMQSNTLYHHSLTAGIPRDMTADVDMSIFKEFVSDNSSWNAGHLEGELDFVMASIRRHKKVTKLLSNFWGSDIFSDELESIVGYGIWASTLSKNI